MPQLPEIVFQMLAFIVGGSVVWGAWSLNQLNIKMAVMVSEMAGNKTQLKDHERRIRDMELT